jgi:magnesium transporter
MAPRLAAVPIAASPRDACAGDEDLGRRHLAGGGDLAVEEAAEGVGRLDHGAVAGNAGLGRQGIHLLRARELARQGVDRQHGGLFRRQLLHQFRVLRRPDEADQGAACAQQADFRRRRYADLEHDVGGRPQTGGAVDDRGAGGAVAVVAAIRGVAGAGFDRHGEAQLDQLFNDFRYRGHTPFARQRFAGNSNCQRHDSPIHLFFDALEPRPVAAHFPPAPDLRRAHAFMRRRMIRLSPADEPPAMTSSKPHRAHPRAAKRLSQTAKVGLAPGALIHLGERKTEQATITLLEYGEADLVERQFTSLAESQAYRPALPVLWLNVHGLHEPEVMAEIGRRFRLHPLVLEDILNTNQRPKVDDYGDYLFIVARFFEVDGDSRGDRLRPGQPDPRPPTSSSASRNVPSGRFDPVRERLRQDRGQIRRLGADYLAYSLLDAIVDRYFTILENIGERTEELEDMMLEHPRPGALQLVHQLKRETLNLRRSIWPLREVINSLTRADERFFRPETRPYLRDVYDHTVHAIESLEASRDMIAGMLDIYLSAASNRVNQEVRALTVVAIIFMPATLISGIFGMNFRTMPLLDWPTGFFVAIGMMAAVATTLSIIFWRRRWLK